MSFFDLFLEFLAGFDGIVPAEVPVLVFLVVVPLEEACGDGADQGPDGDGVSRQLGFDSRAEVADRVLPQPVEGVLSRQSLARLAVAPDRWRLHRVAERLVRLGFGDQDLKSNQQMYFL